MTISLSAQHWITDGNGGYVVYNGAFVKTGQSASSNPDPPVVTGAYDTIWHINYESEAISAWTEAEMEDFWESYNLPYYLGYYYEARMGTDSLYWIEYDTIWTGQRTKVFRIDNYGDELYHGYESNVWLDADSTVYQEMYMSYLFKFGDDIYLNHGGKIGGFEGWPRDPNYAAGNRVADDYGTTLKMNFDYGKIYDYHYDSDGEYHPWSSLSGIQYQQDTVYPEPGTWYEYTIRYKTNSFTGASPNDDGVVEGWLNGRLIYSMNDVTVYDDLDTRTNVGINGVCIDHFYGGSGSSYMPWETMSGYYGEIIVYRDTADATWGTTNLHNKSTKKDTPLDSITTDFYYDYKITSAGAFTNGSYTANDAFDTCQSNMYLIDAGAGNTVQFDLTTTDAGNAWSSDDFLHIYDGKDPSADYLLILHDDYESDISQSLYSTGRYMFVAVHHTCQGAYYNLTGTISFNSE